MADVESREVEWLWQPRIPLRHLTGLQGDPGEGKSFATLAIAAGLSAGRGIPGMEEFEPCNSLILGAEDHLETTVRPRLDHLEPDLTRIHAVDRPFPLNLQGVNHLAGLIENTEARFVVIDPVVAFATDGVDLNKANEVRAFLQPLAEMSEEKGCAIVVVRHQSKSPGGNALHKGYGSIDFIAAFRSGMMAGSDPNDNKSKALIHFKCNWAKLADPVGYMIDDDGKFSWTGATDLTAGQILSDADSALGEANAFLRELLAAGAQLQQEIMTMSKGLGIAPATLRRAKNELGVISTKEGGVKDGAWYWKLPTDEKESPMGDS